MMRVTAKLLVGVSSLCLFSLVSIKAHAAKMIGNEVIYSIMIDRFKDGNQENNIPLWAFPDKKDSYQERNRYWLKKMYYKSVSPDNKKVSIESYWGGDLQGIIEKMDYLHDLGVTTILISSPLENVNGYNYELGGTAYHGYWTKDFKRLEEHFVNPPKKGQTLKTVLSDGVLFKELINKAHSYNPKMKVIMDIALNHTSPAPIKTTRFDSNNYLELGALYNDGTFVTRACSLPGGKTCEESYDISGWFHNPPTWVDWNREETWVTGNINGNLADLNQHNPAVKVYLEDSLKKWLALGLDGFRLDAVKNIYPDFLQDVEQMLVKQKSDIILIGEFFDGGIFENGLKNKKIPASVKWLEKMNHMTMFDFSFATAAREYFSGKMDNLGAPYLLETILDEHAPKNLLKDRSVDLVNFINNHDIPRMLSLKGATLANYMAAIEFMFMAPGVPTLMYGDEVALAIYNQSEHWKTFNSSDAEWSRLMMDWDRVKNETFKNVYSATKKMIQFRKDHSYLRDGETHFLKAQNIFNLLYGTSYLAMERSERNVKNPKSAYFFYSRENRKELIFDVKLEDGKYKDLLTNKEVEVKHHKLTWPSIKANDVLILANN